MKLYEITTGSPEGENSIGGKSSIWRSYHLIARNFEVVLKKATKKLDSRIKEYIRDIKYICEVES